MTKLCNLAPNIIDLYRNTTFNTSISTPTHSYTVISKWSSFWRLVEYPPKWKCQVCGTILSGHGFSARKTKLPLCKKHLLSMIKRKGYTPSKELFDVA